jgi:hypothetical protein
MRNIIYGYSSTTDGIIFLSPIGDCFAIYEHIPNTDPNLKFHFYTCESDYIYDVNYSNAFVVVKEDNYAIYDFNDNGICEITLSNEYKKIYFVNEEFVFVSYNDNHISSIDFVDREGNIKRHLSKNIGGFTEGFLLDFWISQNGDSYYLYDYGVSIREFGNCERTYNFVNKLDVSNTHLLHVTQDHIFINDNTTHQLSELALTYNKAVISKSLSIPLVYFVLQKDENVLVSTFNQIYDWESQDYINGCDNTAIYILGEDKLYSVQYDSILMPY